MPLAFFSWLRRDESGFSGGKWLWIAEAPRLGGCGEEGEKEECCCLRGEPQEAARMFVQHIHLPPSGWVGQVWE